VTSAAQGRAEIKELLRRHGHRPNKALGQHFLADPNLVDRIVRAARIGPGDRVVEVGAGTGTLTAALAATGANVVAFEVDRHLEPLLAEAVGGLDVDVRFESASVRSIGLLGEGPWTLVANLPYNVGTPLVLDLLQENHWIERYVVMVQSEVAERLAAVPGSRRYGLPSVIAGLWGEVHTLFAVSPQVFYPSPDVDSAVIEIIRRPAVSPLAAAAVRLAAAAFGQRRKMLRSSLSGVLASPAAVLEAAGIAPTARPETLEPEAFVRLAGVVENA
jgi:16S rRNA (adenine1518-N6/adenine1519-N6)-dimethyltransferase